MALSLSEVVNIAKNQDWAHISNFSVDISPVNSSYASKIQWKNFSDIQKQIDVSLKSVDVPQHSVATIEKNMLEHNGNTQILEKIYLLAL